MNKTIKLGQIYGLLDKDKHDYHPHLIITISKKHTYLLKGTSVKVDIYNQETNYYEEQEKEFIEIVNSDLEDKTDKLKYKTAFDLSTFDRDKQKEEELRENGVYLGRIDKWTFNKIIHELINTQWEDSEIYNDNSLKDIFNKQLEYDAWENSWSW